MSEEQTTQALDVVNSVDPASDALQNDDAGGNSGNADESPEALAEKLAAAQHAAAENWDKLLRVQAEMDNLRRRTEKDLQNAHKYALEKFARELLAVVDSLELGIQAATGDSPEVAKLREGSDLTLKQLLGALEKFGVAQIDPHGQKFNPELHQAMAVEPSAEAEPNTVVKVFQKGYQLNDRLLRPAMVVIAQQA
ncbi:nucleotide exchange factor GrpE [Candidatus Methylospira mobilis]|uniref:Protein GrpE n=1 Tax=Candidatus Methylospira mobilis TaxID=1808979 RepID=A0A5Q0BFL0_9GAMM|nr:nucleotide exchange factor GrpE [Candidatus Methylospira mobilis]QFY42610.1 nucleotide exchange factor GrpE [Candidatus Methylospira mobilis]WNV04273.1 nucleotide exchange factor GrpE [Candidatus Methylospira mobilis]